MDGLPCQNSFQPPGQSENLWNILKLNLDILRHTLTILDHPWPLPTVTLLIWRATSLGEGCVDLLVIMTTRSLECLLECFGKVRAGFEAKIASTGCIWQHRSGDPTRNDRPNCAMSWPPTAHHHSNAPRGLGAHAFQRYPGNIWKLETHSTRVGPVQIL